MTGHRGIEFVKQGINRRDLLSQATALAAAGLAGGALAAAEDAAIAAAPSQPEPFAYCLNTSTLRGHNLTLVEEIDIAAKAGYQAIEPWIREIQAYIDQGGKLPDLKNRVLDAGLEIPSAIGFAPWIVDDDPTRRAGLETARQDMDLVRQIGGSRIAAPPAGATEQSDLNLLQAAQRYRALLDLGAEMGVTPQIEIWGFSKSLNRLGEVMFVALESGHPDACLLPDVYHIYKGGSDFSGLRLISGRAMHVFHLNDYPANPPRDKISDSHRVYPGDGVAPLFQIIRDLRYGGFHGFLSLELFNREYWMQDPLNVARTGLEKMRSVVHASSS